MPCCCRSPRRQASWSGSAGRSRPSRVQAAPTFGDQVGEVDELDAMPGVASKNRMAPGGARARRAARTTSCSRGAVSTLRSRSRVAGEDRLPVPGAPASTTREPAGSPPPSTLSRPGPLSSRRRHRQRAFGDAHGQCSIEGLRMNVGGRRSLSSSGLERTASEGSKLWRGCAPADQLAAVHDGIMKSVVISRASNRRAAKRRTSDDRAWLPERCRPSPRVVRDHEPDVRLLRRTTRMFDTSVWSPSPT